MLSSASSTAPSRAADSRHSDSINRDLQSLTNDWEKSMTGANRISPLDSILKQSLPASLATPAGWHSEIWQPSASTGNQTQASSISTRRNLVEQHEEYKTMNSSNAPRMILPSSSEANRVVDEIPSAAMLSLRKFGPEYDYCRGAMNSSTIRERKEISTEIQRSPVQESSDDDQPPPLVLHKKLANDQVTYQQNISVKYLQPPTPPPPGPIIIREVRPPPPAPASPIQVRQRPPPPLTPPPIVIRERPPPPPARQPAQVVEKLLPPPPRPPRRMIIERFASCPPKPPDVVIERWLPYRRSEQRRVLVERAPAPYMAPREPNLVIVHETPRARVEKEFINEGIIRADPETYIQRYGNELNARHTQFEYLVDEAARTVPPPPLVPRDPFISSNDYHHSSAYPSPHLSHVWDRMRSVSPIGQSVSSYQDYWRNDLPSHSYSPSFSRSDRQSFHPYDEYPTRGGNVTTMVDVTPSWGRYCRSSMTTPAYMPSYTARTIRVNSDGELQSVLSDLTNDQVPSPFRSY